MAYVLHCDDFSTSFPFPDEIPANQCMRPFYVEVPDSPGVFPPLSVEDAGEIAGAIALLWVIAFVWREIRRAVTSTM